MAECTEPPELDALPPPGRRASVHGSGGTAQSGPTWTYLVVSLGLAAAMARQTWNRQWSTDVWVHLAAVETLRHDLVDPVNELTLAAQESTGYTPYTFVLAIVARLTGLESVTVLQFAAMANLILFLAGFCLFTSTVSGRRHVPAAALVATLVMWGPRPWRWSGFLNLNSVGFGLPYPSMFATGLALVVAWALLRWDATGQRRWLSGVTIGVAVIALSHPFTAMWAMVMLLSLAVHRRLFRRDRLVSLLASGAVVAALVMSWPYFTFLELRRGGDAFAGVSAPLYSNLLGQFLAVMPGFYVVLRRLRDDRTDPLALMLLGGAAVYGFGWVTDDASFGRVLPLVFLSAHIGIGLAVVELLGPRRPRRPVMAAWVGVSFMIGLVGIAPAFARLLPDPFLAGSIRDDAALRPITEPYDELAGALPRGSVVVTDSIELARAAPGYGIGVVVPGYPVPLVTDLDQRRSATWRYLDPATPDATRRVIADRYGIVGVLCRSGCESYLTDHEVLISEPGWTLLISPSAE